MIIPAYFLFFKVEIASLVTGQVSLPAVGTWIHTFTRSVTDYTINANLNNFTFIQMSDCSIDVLIRHIHSHVSSEDIIFLSSVIYPWHHESPKISHTLVIYYTSMNALLYYNSLKIFTLKKLKMSLHVSILTSSSGSKFCSLLKLYDKSELFYYIFCWCGSITCVCIYVVSVAGRSVNCSRPTSLQHIQHIHIHTICCRINETFNKIINF